MIMKHWLTMCGVVVLAYVVGFKQGKVANEPLPDQIRRNGGA